MTKPRLAKVRALFYVLQQLTKRGCAYFDTASIFFSNHNFSNYSHDLDAVLLLRKSEISSNFAINLAYYIDYKNHIANNPSHKFHETQHPGANCRRNSRSNASYRLCYTQKCGLLPGHQE